MPERPIVTDLDIGLCVAIFLWFAAVADQAVLPGIDYYDLQSVLTGCERLGDFYAEGLGPGGADGLAVERDGSNADVRDFVELEPVTLATGRFQTEGIRVGRLA